jgi:hypothetical protein
MVTNAKVAEETELIETGEKHDTLGRRHTPAEQRAELVAAYRASGLSVVTSKPATLRVIW